MEKIWQWRRWQVYLYTKDWKKIARKVALDDSTKYNILKEAKLLKKLNKYDLDFIPKILEIWNDYFDYEYIQWNHFKNVYENSNKKDKKKLVLSLLKNAYQLDKLWIVHWELIRPYTNVLVNQNNKIYIIDFGRWSIDDFSGKNMRSLAQWLKNEWYLSISELVKMQKIKNSKDLYYYIYNKIIKFNLFWVVFWISLLIWLDLITKFIFYDKWILQSFVLISPAFNEWIAWWLSIDMLIIYWITILSLIIFVFLYHKNWISSLVFVLFFAWAVWNFVDRIYLGWVRDFISIWNFPVFNLADAYLTIALLILLYEEIRG